MLGSTLDAYNSGFGYQYIETLLHEVFLLVLQEFDNVEDECHLLLEEEI